MRSGSQPAIRTGSSGSPRFTRTGPTRWMRIRAALAVGGLSVALLLLLYRLAQLQITDHGRYERLAVGDTLQGWKGNMIGNDAVRLSRNGEDRTLLLVNR